MPIVEVWGNGDRYPKRYDEATGEEIKEDNSRYTVKTALQFGSSVLIGYSSEPIVTKVRCPKDPLYPIKRDVQKKSYNKYDDYETNKRRYEAELAKVLGY